MHVITVVPETETGKKATDMGMFSLMVPCRRCRHDQRLQEILLASLFFICSSSFCSFMYSNVPKPIQATKKITKTFLYRISSPLLQDSLLQHSYDQTPLLLSSRANDLIYIFKFILFVSPVSHMQKTHQSALQVQQKAEALLQANHYDMDMIRDCAEKVLLSGIVRSKAMHIIASGCFKVINHKPVSFVSFEGGGPLATADAEDGGPTQTGQCFCGLLQDL